ncbi:hypothetical protein MAMO4S_03174 [Mesorhizobium amorphae]
MRTQCFSSHGLDMVAFAIPASIEPLFVSAGWRPDRWRDGTVIVPKEHPSIAILREFAGLVVGESGTGETCARMALSFGSIGEVDEQIEELEAALGLTIVGIAEDGLGYETIYIDGQGRVFCTNVVAEGLYLAGRSFGEACEALLLGRATTPILLDRQYSVPFYGVDLQRGDPRLVTVAQLRDS